MTPQFLIIIIDSDIGEYISGPTGHIDISIAVSGDGCHLIINPATSIKATELLSPKYISIGIIFFDKNFGKNLLKFLITKRKDPFLKA